MIHRFWTRNRIGYSRHCKSGSLISTCPGIEELNPVDVEMCSSARHKLCKKDGGYCRDEEPRSDWDKKTIVGKKLFKEKEDTYERYGAGSRQGSAIHRKFEKAIKTHLRKEFNKCREIEVTVKEV